MLTLTSTVLMPFSTRRARKISMAWTCSSSRNSPSLVRLAFGGGIADRGAAATIREGLRRLTFCLRL